MSLKKKISFIAGTYKLLKTNFTVLIFMVDDCSFCIMSPRRLLYF